MQTLALNGNGNAYYVGDKDDSNRTISASTTAENIKEYVNNSLGEQFNPNRINTIFRESLVNISC